MSAEERAGVLKLHDIFESFFNSRIASSPDEIEKVLRIRYRVYCHEASYFNPENYPEGLERDIYDDRSLQGMLVYRPTDTPVGAVRLILPASDTDTVDRFPFEAVCPAEVHADLKIPWNTTAEISRFCLTRELAGEIGRTPPEVFKSLTSSHDVTTLEPRQFVRCAKVGLIRAIIQMAAHAGVTHWWAVMEPPLLRSLGRLGVHFHCLGDPIDYYGLRQPCYGEADEMIQRLKHERRDVWEVATDGGSLWP